MNEKEFINLYIPTRFIDVKNYAQVEKEFKQNLDSFKATIVQAERERCAKIVEKERESQGNAYIYFNNKLAKITKAIRED